MAGIGFGQSSSSSTGRQNTGANFNKQFVLDVHNTLGGPLTITDLFKLAPRPRSLFGYGPTMAEEPSGKFNLGFGPPQAGSLASAAPGAPQVPVPGTPTVPTDVTGAPPGDAGLGSTPAAKPEKTFKLADLENAYFQDPDKTMDLQRLFKQAGLDPGGFTYTDFERAVNKAKKYGFSGRSRGNFSRALAGLQRDDTLEEEFAGGKGSGIF